MNFYALPLLFISYSILFFLVCHCQEFYSYHDISYDDCSAGERCGKSILKYPFYSINGFDSFTAYCDNSLLNNTNYVVIRDYYTHYYDKYRILDDLTESSYVNHTITLRVAYDDLSECSSVKIENLGSIPTGFNLSHEYTINGTLLDCDGELPNRLNSTFQQVAALVYEHMINGSLEKYIHGSQDTHPDHVLDSKQFFSIAIGTARGIAYLHEECANRILHCDIKPHNVLLDANYSPKVADFGLAKLGKREESHMSITAARGTPGYAAPEMWSRNCGPVTDKSDVYGFGMLLLEMVGGRKNMDVEGSRASQFYFPEWAFKQAEKGEFEKLRMRSEVGGINGAEDENIEKKLTWRLSCIHYDSSHRPSMVKVIQMLEGSVQVTTPSFPFPMPTRLASDTSGESSSYSS
eukprot:Gb_05389 [translate_table: standard]